MKNFLVRPKQNCEGGGARREAPHKEQKLFLGLFCRAKIGSIRRFSGDSDFGGLLGYLKSKGKKVIVVCTRNRMSSELQTVADKFIPAETLAKFLQYIPKQTRPSC